MRKVDSSAIHRIAIFSTIVKMIGLYFRCHDRLLASFISLYLLPFNMIPTFSIFVVSERRKDHIRRGNEAMTSHHVCSRPAQ